MMWWGSGNATAGTRHAAPQPHAPPRHASVVTAGSVPVLRNLRKTVSICISNGANSWGSEKAMVQLEDDEASLEAEVACR
jgi:hypothetical protein